MARIPRSLRCSTSLGTDETASLCWAGIEVIGALEAKPSSTNTGWMRSDGETVTSRTSSRITGVLRSRLIRRAGKLTYSFASENLPGRHQDLTLTLLRGPSKVQRGRAQNLLHHRPAHILQDPLLCSAQSQPGQRLLELFCTNHVSTLE